MSKRSEPPISPGTNVARNAGIYQETGPRGGLRPNFATGAEGKRLPPTTETGNGWTPVDPTPHGRRK